MKLKPYNFTGEVKNIIVNNIFVKKEQLIDSTTLDLDYDYFEFDILKRNKFCFSSFTALIEFLYLVKYKIFLFYLIVC